jgi:hypothetical protein
MIEVAFRKLLTVDATVAALVVDRVYFGNRPQNERRPSIVLYLVSQTVPGMTYRGQDFSTGRMQLNCLAPTYPQAKQLAAAARTALDGFTGTQDGTEVGYILISNYRDIPVMPLQGAAQPATFGVSIDAIFMVKEE